MERLITSSGEHVLRLDRCSRVVEGRKAALLHRGRGVLRSLPASCFLRCPSSWARQLRPDVESFGQTAAPDLQGKILGRGVAALLLCLAVGVGFVSMQRQQRELELATQGVCGTTRLAVAGHRHLWVSQRNYYHPEAVQRAVCPSYRSRPLTVKHRPSLLD
jgi:hypothetical protein